MWKKVFGLYGRSHGEQAEISPETGGDNHERKYIGNFLFHHQFPSAKKKKKNVIVLRPKMREEEEKRVFYFFGVAFVDIRSEASSAYIECHGGKDVEAISSAAELGFSGSL
jgi:hypothetical protein